ncbi:helix-turn-helix transcriptional regulator [Nonomuraea lactucae]|uniref:helix-turn-helix transcriptional regulator n=1 Tax=Nonomuraea lactucae TaxID=2249762 RepID=UPI001F06C617|nr:LuxR family transcriptional regulator [Nonomuraea lactucae]
MTRLFGRNSQVEHLRGLIEHVGRSGAALIVRGEAGVGKSALLAEASAVAAARGMRILGACGVESETHLPFAALQSLLHPVRSLLDRLPGPQRQALRVAFGMNDAAAPDLFLIALASLNLLAEVAATTPVLIVVEDGHWIDRSSADVLAFVARRLDAEPVVLLAAVREESPSRLDDVGLPEIALEPLADDAAAALLAAHAPDLTQEARQRLLKAASGNPLALIELATLAPEHSRNLDHLPLTARLQQAFASRLPDLPASTRALLLIAALNDSDVLAESSAAAELIAGESVGADTLAPAITARLLKADGPVAHFRHPLMRSAVYQAATTADRRRAHAALAQVLGEGDDRAVWHRAAAAQRPDEALAVQLESMAARARRRGDVVAAAAALERGAELSQNQERRADRLLRAATLAVELGRQDTVARLLARTEPLALSPQQRARAVWIRGSFDDGMHGARVSAPVLASLAEQVAADGDVDLAVRILWSGALRCFWSEPGSQARQRVVDVAESLPLDASDPRLLAILAYAAPIERGGVVIDGLRRLDAAAGADPEATRLLGSASVLVGTFDVGRRLSAASLDGLRAEGRLQLVTRALAAQAWSAAQLGYLQVAGSAAAEAAELATETSQPYLYGMARAIEAQVAGLRGEDERAYSLAGEAERVSLPVGARPVLATVQIARGLAALCAGRYAEAYDHLRRVHDPADPAYQLALRCHTLADLAEAAAHSGQGAAMRDVLAEMEEAALITPSPSLHAGLRHARAVLAESGEAEALHQASLAADLSWYPLARARAQLAHGRWLRRNHRVADSRQPLRIARDAFDALGVLPWSERARQELRAAGESSRPRVEEVSDRLTPQELQIAQLVAEGLTNKEISQRLYVSHRTIGAHLYRIFPKLGITSRSELGGVLSRRRPGPA